MADSCYTCYKLWGERVGDLWNSLTALGLPDDRVAVKDFLKHNGVEWHTQDGHLRGVIVYASMDNDVLTMGVESAWLGCQEAIEAVTKGVFGLSVSWREEELSNGVVVRHDEGGFFPENYLVSASCGAPWHFKGDFVYFSSAAEVIAAWCTAMKIERGERNEAEMLQLIEDWECDDDAFFNVYEVTDF